MGERVLVTGASGSLGPAVVAAFAQDGWQVRAWSRRSPPANLFPAGVEPIAGDISDERVVGRAVRDVSVVIHLAGLLHVASPTERLVPEYDRINIDGTAHLLSCARDAGARRFVLASTTCVYGASRGEPLHEAVPPDPDTPYARTKLAAEQLVLQAVTRSGAPFGSALRLAAVYGARVKGNYRRLLQALAGHRFVWIGSGANRRALIHDRDAARAFALVAVHPSAAGRVFNVSDGDVHTMRNIVAAMCDALGVGAPRLSVPAAWARAAAAGVEGLAALVGRPAPVSRATIDKFMEDIVVDSARIGLDLDFRPAVRLTEGWRSAVTAMREQGEIR